jgi:hypothetical protein
MRRTLLSLGIAFSLVSCGGTQPQTAPAKPVAEAKPPAKITQFYSSTPLVASGAKGTLCYGVENAVKVELVPPVEEVWPSPTRCFEVDPNGKATFTLTAIGADGSRDSKTVDLRRAGPAPRVFDLWASSLNIHPGEEVQVCFKVENATHVTAGPGEFSREKNCIRDRPAASTTYRIVASGVDGQQDTGNVPVTVK